MAKSSLIDRIKENIKIQSELLEEMEMQPHDWGDVEVDLLIEVRDGYNSTWSKAYFCKYNSSEDTVNVFLNGATSVTSERFQTKSREYNFMRLVNKGEKKYILKKV